MITLTLALGIGANTAIFSIANGWLFRPLPVPNANQLVVVASQQSGESLLNGISYPDFLDYRGQADALVDLSAYRLGFVGLHAGATTERIIVNYVAGNFFSMLGVRPFHGRFILPSEGENLGSPLALVLAHSYWKRRFSGDPNIIGETVLVNGQPVTVVGVTPPEFYGVKAFLETEAYLPLTAAAIEPNSSTFWHERRERALNVLGRLRPGIDLRHAQVSVDVIAERLRREYPDADKETFVRIYPEWLARPDPNAASTAPIIAAVFLILGALVLLLTCFNVANVLLARSSFRQHELAIRSALGASRLQIILQVVTESVVLALIAGIVGLLLGLWGTRVLSFMPLQLDVPFHLDFTFDRRVFAYALAAALFTGIFASLMPAVRSLRIDFNSSLREGERSAPSSPLFRRARNALVVVQVAGSLTLLLVAGLFIRSLSNAARMELGFEPDRVLNVATDPRQAGYDETHAKQLQQELLRRVRTIPGVESASFAYSVPFGYRYKSTRVFVEHQLLKVGDPGQEIFHNIVSPEYFGTMQIPILTGRAFSESDNQNAPRVAVINVSMAHLFWLGEVPIGKTFRFGSLSDPPVQIVGIARDGKYQTPVDRGVPYFYLPLAQYYVSELTLQVRTSVAPEGLVDEVKRQINSLDPMLPVFDVKTMKDLLEGANGTFPLRFAAGLAGMMGLLGAVLSTIGVYGLVSYIVSERKHEIALRLAIGAQRWDVLKLVVREGMRLVVVGLFAGIILSMIVARVVSSLLIGITAKDPTTFASASLLLAISAFVACSVPAVRAMRVDLLRTLRC